MRKLIRDHLSNSGKPFAKVIPSQALKIQGRCRDLMAGTLTVRLWVKRKSRPRTDESQAAKVEVGCITRRSQVQVLPPLLKNHSLVDCGFFFACLQQSRKLGR